MIKKLMDFTISLAGLIILSPVILILAFLIYLKLGSPIIFKQKRPGYKGKPYVIYKFRTMTNERDEAGNLLSNKDRSTKFGNQLRSTSLDELPELINVLKGDMSLVGPRPLKIEYLPYYTEEQARRHDVKPGITGWAQVNGRNALSWDEHFKFDLWYVNNHSIWLDIKILARTLKAVVTRKGNLPKESAGRINFKRFKEQEDSRV